MVGYQAVMIEHAVKSEMLIKFLRHSVVITVKTGDVLTEYENKFWADEVRYDMISNVQDSL